MSVRLKSRDQCPPNGFMFEQKEIGWKSWVQNPPNQWDFHQLCKDLQAVRMANVGLAIKHKWNTDLGAIQDEVDQANAIRVMVMSGAESYIVAGGTAPPKQVGPASALGKVDAAVKRVRRLVAGAGTLMDWLGSNQQPVSPTLAENRASICAKCPKNDMTELTGIFTEPASKLIREQVAKRNQLNLTTPSDSKLGVCSACFCPMKLKIWLDLEFIKSHTSPEVETELDPGCWIKLEA